MVGRAIDDKSPDTLVVVSGEGFWTGSSTLPHLHHFFALPAVGSLLRAPKPRLMITAAALWLRASDTETPGHGRPDLASVVLQRSARGRRPGTYLTSVLATFGSR